MNETEFRRVIKEFVEETVGQIAGKPRRKAIFTGDSRVQYMDIPMLGDENWKSFGEFLFTVKDNPRDSRLKAGLVEGTDSLGGFVVPEIMSNQLLMDTIEASIVRKFATKFTMTSDTLLVPKIVDTTHAAGLFGGAVAYWTEEAGSATAKEPTFGQVKLIAHKLMGYTYASNELLADFAAGLEQVLRKIWAGTLTWYEEYAFLQGNGVGQPLGILNSGALLSVNRSAANTIALADLAAIWARMFPQSHDRAVWIANPAVLPQLLPLATTSLTWLSVDQGVAQTPPAKLLGRPLYFSEKVPTLGTAGDIGLYDLSYYLISDRKQFQVSASEHTRFTTDETAWRFVERVDGQPWVDSAFTPKNGSSLSPFVTLHSTTNGGD